MERVCGHCKLYLRPLRQLISMYSIYVDGLVPPICPPPLEKNPTHLELLHERFLVHIATVASFMRGGQMLLPTTYLTEGQNATFEFHL